MFMRYPVCCMWHNIYDIEKLKFLDTNIEKNIGNESEFSDWIYYNFNWKI